MNKKKVRYLLELLADNTKWAYTTCYFDRGCNPYYTVEWIGDEDVREMAVEILQDIEDEYEN